MKILLVLTVYNEIEITDRCLNIIKQNYPNIDILLIDDYSQQDIMKSLARKYKVFYISKVNHPGLTNSWNLGYKFFKENNYDILFISNNDLLIPKNTLNLLIDNFINNDFLVCVPSSTVKGAGIGKCGIAQGIAKLDNIDVNNHKNFQIVQDHLINNPKYHELRPTNFFNGFFFGLKKEISTVEFKPNILFNPRTINLCNEIDLYNRINAKFKNQNKILHVKHAFIFHFKAVTINIHKRDDLKLIEKKYN